MKILYNRYNDSQNRLISIIGKYMSLDETKEAVAETPTYIKLLSVHEEKTTVIPYPEFERLIKENKLKQIIL